MAEVSAGTRIVGGGFGGSAIALCRHADTPGVTKVVEGGFRKAGFRPPRIVEVQPINGATAIV